jgi:hypothetical protein
MRIGRFGYAALAVPSAWAAQYGLKARMAHRARRQGSFISLSPITLGQADAVLDHVY